MYIMKFIRLIMLTEIMRYSMKKVKLTHKFSGREILNYLH